MEKYFYSKGTRNWIDVLDDFTKNYNNTKHSSIHMKPKDVNKTNENIVWVTLYGHVLEGLQPPKFKVGDTVRVSKYKSIFAKGYEANFIEEIFKVSKVLRPYRLRNSGSRRRTDYWEILRTRVVPHQQKRRYVQDRKNTSEKERNGVS